MKSLGPPRFFFFLSQKDGKQILKKNEKNDNEVTKFPIDSYVLAENQNYWLVRKEPNKLKPILKGPFKVVAVSEDNEIYGIESRLYETKNIPYFCSPSISRSPRGH